jgi:hypothetical protein
MQFDMRFQRIFELGKKGYTEDEQNFGKMLIGNMAGGLG